MPRRWRSRVPASAGRCGSPRRAQTAGRGRRGSTWVSKPGNLYATLLLTDPSAPAQAPQLSFVAALALHDAVATCAPSLGPALKVKWPNDLLLGGAKLAGILIEGENAPVLTVVVGIGVNCAHHPDDTAVSGHRSRGRRRAGDAGADAGRAGRSHAAPPGAMGARRGLCRHPRRLAQARRRAWARKSACACRSASSPACFRGSMTPAGSWCSRRASSRRSPPAKCSVSGASHQ